jgi:HAMP domain-containing protein
MTIRSRLLLLLFPSLITFLLLICLFFYFNWSKEIINSFSSNLKSIVVTGAQSINGADIEAIAQHIHDPQTPHQPIYLENRQRLLSLQQKLPITNIFIIQVLPVKEGEMILLDSPNHPENTRYLGSRPEDAYREIMLLDIPKNNREQGAKPGEYDFSENDERQVYLTKEPYVTPIYETRKTHERLISAYAPILNKQGDVVALLGADVGISEIEKKLNRALLLIIIGALTTLGFIAITIFLIAENISRPMRRLNQAALAIAAGDYEANIPPEGPKEITELANTLNTMSECLNEHIIRLKNSSLVRERMHGEYECTLLLQHYMLQKNIEDFNNPNVRLLITSFPENLVKEGVLLTCKSDDEHPLILTFLEAKETGFIGLFTLNQRTGLPIDEDHDSHFIETFFSQDYRSMTFRYATLPPPFVWSFQEHQFVPTTQQKVELHHNDMIFLGNSSLLDVFGSAEKIQVWLGRILRHFANDGLEIIQVMIANELKFLNKKQLFKQNIHIVGLQMNLPERV